MDSLDLDLSLDVPGYEYTPGESNTIPKAPMEVLDKGNHGERLIVELPKEESLTTVKIPYNTDSNNDSLTEPKKILGLSYQEVPGHTEVKMPYLGNKNVAHGLDLSLEGGNNQTPVKEVVANGHQSDSRQETHPKRPYPQPEGTALLTSGLDTHPKVPYMHVEDSEHSNSRQETQLQMTYTASEGLSEQRSRWVNFPVDDESPRPSETFDPELPSPPPSYSGLPTNVRQNGYNIGGQTAEQYSTSESHTEPKQRVSTSAEAIGRGNNSAPLPTSSAQTGVPRLITDDSETTQVKIVANDGIPAGNSDGNRWETFDPENGGSGPPAGLYNQPPSLPPYSDLPTHLRQDPSNIETPRQAQTSSNDSDYVSQTHLKEPVSTSRQGGLTAAGSSQEATPYITNDSNPQVERAQPSPDHQNTEDFPISEPPSITHVELNPDEHWVTARAMNNALNEYDDTHGLIDEDYERCGAPKWAIAVTVILCLAIVISVVVVLVYFLK